VGQLHLRQEPVVPWYFAYGSNMQTATLRGRRGVAWTRAVAARTRGWRVVFDKPPLVPIPHAFANLVPDPEAESFGVAFEVSAADLAHIELTEGVFVGNYSPVLVPVEPLAPLTGFPREAFSLSSEHRDARRRPSSRYMRIVIEGALEHGLPDAWIETLRAVPCEPEHPTAAALRSLVDRALRWRRE